MHTWRQQSMDEHRTGTDEHENSTCLSFGFRRGVRSDENRKVMFIFAHGFVFASKLYFVAVSIRVRQHYTSRHVIKLLDLNEIARQQRQVQKSSRNNVVERRKRTRNVMATKIEFTRMTVFRTRAFDTWFLL